MFKKLLRSFIGALLNGHLFSFFFFPLVLRTLVSIGLFELNLHLGFWVIFGFTFFKMYETPLICQHVVFPISIGGGGGRSYFYQGHCLGDLDMELGAGEPNYYFQILTRPPPIVIKGYRGLQLKFPFQAHLRFMCNLLFPIAQVWSSFQRRRLIIFTRTFMIICMNIHFLTSSLICLIILMIIMLDSNHVHDQIPMFGSLFAYSF